MILNASPIEFVPVAQAVTVEPLGPFAPKSIETWPVAMSGISIGTKKGLTLLGPLFFSIVCATSNVSIPPIPEPIHTPIRLALSSLIVKLASSTACLAATTAYCVKRSMRRASFRNMIFNIKVF